MFTRRKFIKLGMYSGLGVMLPASVAKQAFALSLPALLDPATQTKYVNELPNLLDPAFIFVPTGTGQDRGSSLPAYELQIRQFRAKIGLQNPAHGGPLMTTLWGYGTSRQQPTYPGRTFQVSTGGRIVVSYNNQLLTPTGNTLPHLLPIDVTIDWANTGNNGATAPVPLVAHLHGGNTQYLSDGLPDGWETPNAVKRGSLWSKPYIYDNAQEAAHLWYHDHALGVTRLNVFTGLAGNYFIRGLDELALVTANKLPSYPYEVPLVIQDRQFLANGELYYPSDPSLYPFDEGGGPTIPLPPVTHLPEFFGDIMLVNGVPWPQLDVEPRQYRFRLLNASDSRVYELRVETGVVPQAGVPAPMFVIGTELGLLNAPVPVEVLRIAPGERYDLVVDFTGLDNRRLTLTNTANAPYPDADPPVPGVSDQIMQFSVKRRQQTPRTPVATTLPAKLRPVSGDLPVPNPQTATKIRKILLVEGTDQYGRLMTMLGPIDPTLPLQLQGTLFFKDPVTEKPVLGTTEIWEFYNTTVDAHPIHMHLVDFRVLSRQRFTIAGGDPNANFQAKDMGGGFTGGIVDPAGIGFIDPDTATPFPAIPAPPWESGKKDTAVMFPGQVTRVLVQFRRTGFYVFHCHILSHEDHEMMRPYEVVA